MLQLILGRSGYGKTEYVFNSIKKLVDNGEDVILITPEQYSFIAERRLLSELGESGISKVQNMSFSRLNNEVTNLFGGNDYPVLSKGSKAVMMKKAVEMVQDGLILFNKNANQTSFINLFIKIYDEMKSCRVSVDDIYNAANDVDKKALSDKLKDIAAIISAYDALISNKYLDPADELTRLYSAILQNNYFNGKTVFVDGFSGFVAQEYKILETAIKQAKGVYITLCSDSYVNNDKFDLFYYVNSNIQILKQVTKSVGERFLNPIVLEDNFRCSNDELKIIEKNLYSKVKKTFDNESNNVKIYSAKNIYDECDKVSSQINDLLRAGYRAKEISVICRDLDKYKSNIEFSFKKYNIPFFDDERQNIASQPLIMFVNFLMRTVIYSYNSDDIFSLLKTGLTSLNDNEMSDLENYCFVWNINGSKWNKEFVNSTKGFVEKITDSDQQKINQINKSREYITEKLNKFKNSVKNKNSKDICKAIYYSLLDFNCDEELKKLAISLDESGKSHLANEQGRIWDMLMNILDDLAVIGGDETINLKEFYDLFNLYVSNEDLGVLPSGLDNIQVGSADRIRCDNPRIVFVLGANEGEFPQSVTSAGLLSENDRIELINNKFKLYSYGEILNAQERYFAYMALTCAKEKLYISYCSSSESSVITEILDIDKNVNILSYNDKLNVDMIQTKENAFELLSANFTKKDTVIASLKEYFKSEKDYSSRVDAVNNLIENKDIAINDTNIAVDLFKKDMYLSASRIEDYFNCSFRYFCKFGIGAKPRQKAEFDPMQSGTVIHYVLEQIIKEKGSDGLKSLEYSKIPFEVNKYLTEYLNNKMGNTDDFTPRLKYQFMRLSKMLVSVVTRLKDEFENSDFEPRAFEYRIGDGSKGETVKSKVFKLDDGGTIKINGSIDRVDSYIENDKQYIRVVDYKSGTKKFKLSDIIYGLNLQMFIYLFTLCQSDDKLAGINSGVLYLHSARNVANIERNPSDDTIKKQENSDFQMFGVVLNDDENSIAEHMERDLKGKYIPVKYSNKNGITGDIVSLEDLGRISRKIDNLIAQMGNNLHIGKISQNPINSTNHNKTCEFCDYNNICKNKIEINYKDVEEYTNLQVLNMLKEDQENA